MFGPPPGLPRPSFATGHPTYYPATTLSPRKIRFHLGHPKLHLTPDSFGSHACLETLLLFLEVQSQLMIKFNSNLVITTSIKFHSKGSHQLFQTPVRNLSYRLVLRLQLLQSMFLPFQLVIRIQFLMFLLCIGPGQRFLT